MSNSVTFFRQKTGSFSTPTVFRTPNLLFYAPKKIERKRLSGLNEKDLKERVYRIVDGEGGLCIHTLQQNGQTFVGYFRSPSKQGYAPPDSCLLLQAGLEPEWLPFEQIKEPFVLDPTAHILVPVDVEAQRKLAAFLDFLNWLPYDQRASVLETLRRPSLDLRLSDLELRLGELEKLRQRSHESRQVFSWEMLLRPIVWAPVLVAIIILAVAIWRGPDIVSYFAAAPESKTANKEYEQSDLRDAEKQLSNAAWDLRTTVGQFKRWYFQKVYKDYFRNAKRDEPFANEKFVLGIYKLIDLTPETVGSDVDLYKIASTEQSSIDRVPEDSRYKNLYSYFSCITAGQKTCTSRTTVAAASDELRMLRDTATAQERRQLSPLEINLEIQSLLKEQGYPIGSVDGKLGPGTMDAVQKFQKGYGLKEGSNDLGTLLQVLREPPETRNR